MKKKIISVLLCCCSIITCILPLFASSVNIENFGTSQKLSSTSISMVQKDFETNLVEKKIYSQSLTGDKNVKVVDSWTDDSNISPSITALNSGFNAFDNYLPRTYSASENSDGRTVVEDTTIFPYSAIVHLEIFFGLKVYRATGFLIADNIVATAAHCLYDEEMGWATNVTVRPGRNGALLPFGVATSKLCAVSTEWYETGDRNYDWGAIAIHDSIIGDPGTFNLADDVTGIIDANICGYPAFVESSIITTKKQYEMGGEVFCSPGNLCYFSITISEGQSGAPILDENNNVVGIVTALAENTGIGARITPQVSYYLNEFIAEND